jgi:hypothetical protein
MKMRKCNNCKEDKEEIEFEYLFFRKKYENICKLCKERFIIIEKEKYFKK